MDKNIEVSLSDLKSGKKLKASRMNEGDVDIIDPI